MALLALDFGSSCGFAIERRDGTLEHGVWKFDRGRDALRFAQFRRQLVDTKARLEAAGDPLVQVVFEDVNFMPPQGGVYVLHLWGGFRALTLQWCEHHAIPCRGVAVATIKAHLTKRASAAKQLVQDELKRRGHKITDHNEGDALALLITVGDKFKAVHP